jgi:hypothetical protein
VIDNENSNIFTSPPKSIPAVEKSINRFSDFENGVLFWFRGATSALSLSPWLQSADGEKIHLSTQEIIDKISPTLIPSLKNVSGVFFLGINFAGTTNYWFDGAGIHNRKHRLNATFLWKHNIGPFNIEMPVPIAFEIQIEVTFEPINRKLVAFITDWLPPNATGGIDIDIALDIQLHRIVDPLLWKSIPILEIDDMEAGKPFSILSVKTMSDGQVFTFIEPEPLKGMVINQLIDKVK